MEFRILGPLEVFDAGRPVRLGGRKQRALLAVLLLEANRVVSTDRLIEALWEDEPPETAQKALQVYVSQLRKLLGRERLVTKAPGYMLRVEDAELDLGRFRRLCEEGQPAGALELWRGPPLADFAQERFARSEIGRLEELRLECLEERIEADLASGERGAIVGELEALVREHPLRQRLREQLMLALYRSGRDAEALEVYRDARRALVEELGIEPRRALRELQQAILRQDPALDLRGFEPAAADSARTVFVGRKGELEALTSALGDASAGHGRLLLIVGEPGIGKSRLADELIAGARARGSRVLVGRCWEAGGAPAYWPWLQALRDYLREVDPEALRSELGAGAAVVAQLLPELGEVFPDLPEPPALEAESARFRLFEAVASFLESAAVQRPLVLFLDDLHAADEPSLLLLQFLARELAESRLLVVGAYRDVDPTPAHPLTTAVAELAREPVTRGLALAGLGEDEVARYIDLTTGEAADEELVADIYEETEGNPLFVGEIVRLLATEGSLQAGAARIAIPQSVRDVIARRLSHLSHECNRTLVLASVLGREFNLAALTQLTSVSEDELLDTLDEAMEARVVSDAPAGPGQLRFAHVLIRDALYEGLTTARRVRLHRQAVEALEALYGEEPGAHLAELAHHAIAGSDFQRGFDYVRRAGHRALDLLAYEEAARLYATALETAELTRVSDDVRCDLLLSLAESESRAGSASAAKEAFLEAADLARRLDLPRELALAAAGYGGRIVWARAADDPRLVPLLEEGLSVLGDEDKDLRARLLARLAGGALRDEPARERRDALSREAVELARGGSPVTLAYALSGRAAAIIAPDTLSERLKLGTELCALGGRIADREPTVEGHYHRLIAYLELGEVTSAERELEAMSNLASDLRQPAQLWQVCGIRAMIALAEGRITDAKEFISQALTYGESAQQDAAIAAYRLHLLMLSDFEGRLDAEERPLSDAARDYPARPVFRCALAYLHAQLGAKAEAERALSNLARDDFSSLPFDFEWLYGASLLAETCATVGEAASASVLHRLLEPYAERNVVDAPEGMRGAVARYLGLLAATLQRWDDAARHFENAIAMNERMGARPWLAHTQSDYARTLLARNNADDRARAHDLLDAAYATYRELGMESHAARSSTLRQKLSTVA